MFMLESGNPDNIELEESKCNSTRVMTIFLDVPDFFMFMVAACHFAIMQFMKVSDESR